MLALSSLHTVWFVTLSVQDERGLKLPRVCKADFATLESSYAVYSWLVHWYIHVHVPCMHAKCTLVLTQEYYHCGNFLCFASLPVSVCWTTGKMLVGMSVSSFSFLINYFPFSLYVYCSWYLQSSGRSSADIPSRVETKTFAITTSSVPTPWECSGQSSQLHVHVHMHTFLAMVCTCMY